MAAREERIFSRRSTEAFRALSWVMDLRGPAPLITGLRTLRTAALMAAGMIDRFFETDPEREESTPLAATPHRSNPRDRLGGENLRRPDRRAQSGREWQQRRRRRLWLRSHGWLFRRAVRSFRTVPGSTHMALRSDGLNARSQRPIPVSGLSSLRQDPRNEHGRLPREDVDFVLRKVPVHSPDGRRDPKLTGGDRPRLETRRTRLGDCFPVRRRPTSGCAPAVSRQRSRCAGAGEIVRGGRGVRAGLFRARHRRRSAHRELPTRVLASRRSPACSGCARSHWLLENAELSPAASIASARLDID